MGLEQFVGEDLPGPGPQSDAVLTERDGHMMALTS